MAIPQQNIKRLLAYSGIAHIGYLLMGLAAMSASGIGMMLFYLVAYLFGNMGAFFVVQAVARSEQSDQIDVYSGLARRSPVLALSLLVFLLSLGGIPFMAGFWAKLFVFWAVVERGMYWLAFLGAVATVVALYYYLVVAKRMYIDPPSRQEPIPVPGVLFVAIFLCMAGVVIMGLYPDPWVSGALRVAASLVLIPGVRVHSRAFDRIDRMSRRQVRVFVSICAMAMTTIIAVRAGQSTQIPPGPSVRVSDGWYHLEDCSIAVGRQAPSMPLADALRRSQRPCPICEPLAHQPEWAAFVASHGETIKAEVKAKADADAAEAKRKLDAEEAERVRRLKELEDERKRKESAPVVRLTEAQAREIAVAAAAEAKDDATQFQAVFRSRVRVIAPEYSGPQIVYGSAVLKIIAAGPLARFEAAALDRVQRRLPIGGAVWLA